MSWISLPDLVAAYVFAVENESVAGAINAVAPKPVSNTVFTKTLGKVLRRPTIFPVPAAVVKTLFGDMGKETVLSDLGVLPARLTELGFEWQTPKLADALDEKI
jgi:NAD dependent epimerase/dehydratase family enzyme